MPSFPLQRTPPSFSKTKHEKANSCLSLSRPLGPLSDGVFSSSMIKIPSPTNAMSFLNRSPNAPLSIAAILTLTAAAAAAAARLAVPYSIAALPSAIPLLRFFLEPPYLFITVHLIIVAIWKLSDQNPLKNPNENVTPSKTASAEISVESDAATPISPPKSAESCVTTDSDENSAVSSRFESDDVAAELSDTWRTVVLKKSATWERSSEAAAEVAGEREVRRSATMKELPAAVEGNEELDRRFEEFIRKNYDQIRSY